MSTLLFFYGTLKRGCCNHGQLAGQAFVGEARTLPGFRLYDLGGYPGLVADANDREGVTGEVWSIDAVALKRLDRFEGTHEGLYRREPIALAPPFADRAVEVYVPARAVEIKGLREVGSSWVE
ncbi:MAG TPA: gamma-glutamylcyclotransferase family protein [Opitutaceae bacterium]|nr:gamma-glutamylcyclotransferase family protein [Opitutaceae bacterium]